MNWNEPILAAEVNNLRDLLSAEEVERLTAVPAERVHEIAAAVGLPATNSERRRLTGLSRFARQHRLPAPELVALALAPQERLDSVSVATRLRGGRRPY